MYTNLLSTSTGYPPTLDSRWQIQETEATSCHGHPGYGYHPWSLTDQP